MVNVSRDLDRFVEAQNESYDNIIRELKIGKKVTHWMWYVFPQIAGLGRNATAKFYEIRDQNEARAYLAHPILGQRLLECTKILLTLERKSALDIFGDIDALKLRSSMTLFSSIAGSDSLYQEVIDKYFEGQPDQKTLDIL
jgi:uncharacterized protein (DUF1810 family)